MEKLKTILSFYNEYLRDNVNYSNIKLATFRYSIKRDKEKLKELKIISCQKMIKNEKILIIKPKKLLEYIKKLREE